MVKDAKHMEGLFPLYYNEKEQKLFMEVQQSQYDKEVILPMAIARGTGMMYLGGITLNFGDQWLICFPSGGDRLLVDSAQRARSGQRGFAAGRLGEGFVYRQRDQGPADQEREERRPAGADRPGRSVHDRPGGHRHHARPGAQHVGQGESVPEERRDRSERGLFDAALLVVLLFWRRHSRHTRRAGGDPLRPVDAARRPATSRGWPTIGWGISSAR